VLSEKAAVGDVVLESVLDQVKSTKGTVVFGNNKISGLYIPNEFLAGHKPKKVKIVVTVQEL